MIVDGNSNLSFLGWAGIIQSKEYSFVGCDFLGDSSFFGSLVPINVEHNILFRGSLAGLLSDLLFKNLLVNWREAINSF